MVMCMKVRSPGSHKGSATLIEGLRWAATMYATVSASFVIEQEGLPCLSEGSVVRWNGDDPLRRLETLKKRHTT